MWMPGVGIDMQDVGRQVRGSCMWMPGVGIDMQDVGR
jgi:hypothetical protein